MKERISYATYHHTSISVKLVAVFAVAALFYNSFQVSIGQLTEMAKDVVCRDNKVLKNPLTFGPTCE